MISNSSRILAISAALVLSTGSARAATFNVTNYGDSGVGTLRWAIEQNNARPGGNIIIVGGKAPAVIRLKSILPALIGPLTIKGSLKADGMPLVAIDGSAFINGDDVASCPGVAPAAAPGGPAPAPYPPGGPNVRSFSGAALAITDTGHIEISGLEIRQFCIGIMILRSHDNHLARNVIHNIAGAAGILVTGDDGTPQGNATTGLTTNNLIEYNTIYATGDGMECTRGTSNTTYRFNTLYEKRDRPKVPYSQGIECAGANNDRLYIIGNSFTGYSDGLQLNSATNVLVSGNTISGGTYGITAGGSGTIIGNIITGNRMGIGPAPAARYTITANKIYDNGHAELLSLAGSAGGTTDAKSPALRGIDYGLGRGTPQNGATEIPPPPAAPVLAETSAWSGNSAPVLSGSLTAKANTSYRLEFFASRSLDAQGAGEGEIPVGQTIVTSDANGLARFVFNAPVNPLGDGSMKVIFTATATSPDGITSAFSPVLSLSRQP